MDAADKGQRDGAVDGEEGGKMVEREGVAGVCDKEGEVGSTAEAEPPDTAGGGSEAAVSGVEGGGSEGFTGPSESVPEPVQQVQLVYV